MNNSNFGCNCRNNLNNYIFEPICNQLDERAYLKRYNNIFDKCMSFSVNSKLVKYEIEGNLDEKILRVKDNNFRGARINSLKIKRREDLEAAEQLEEFQKKITQQKPFKEL